MCWIYHLNKERFAYLNCFTYLCGIIQLMGLLPLGVIGQSHRILIPIVSVQVW